MQGFVTNEFRDLCDIGARRWIDEDRIEAFEGVICHITEKTNWEFVRDSIAVAVANERPIALVIEVPTVLEESLAHFPCFSLMREAAVHLSQTIRARQPALA
jgi:hypothetical protein